MLKKNPNFNFINSLKMLRIMRNYSSKVFPALKPTEIKQFLRSPTWNIHKELVETDGDTEQVNKELIDKLLNMSGLEVDDEKEILSKLKEQVLFINKLHSVKVEEGVEKIQNKELNLDDILNQIKELKKEESKGELGNWNPTKLSEISKNEFYIVREGLIKK